MENGYKDSRLWLNKYLSKAEKWGKKEVEKRFELIAERFLKIWDIPEISIDEDIFNPEVNIFDAEAPKGKKLEYAIFISTKLEIREVAKLYNEVIKQLFNISSELFFTTDLGRKVKLCKSPSELSLRQPVAINETYFIEGNMDSTNKFEKIKDALTIFEMEDELSIKYVGT